MGNHGTNQLQDYNHYIGYYILIYYGYYIMIYYGYYGYVHHYSHILVTI